jgi:hypothetical protein
VCQPAGGLPAPLRYALILARYGCNKSNHLFGPNVFP